MRALREMAIAAIACTALSASISGAVAADMDYPVVGSPVVHTPVEFGSGWYLRGDIGLTVMQSSSGTYYSTAFGPDVDYADEEFGGHDVTISAGFGYHFNDFLRADLTLEHNSGMEWEGLSQAAPTSTGESYFEAEAEVERTSLMANGYVSLGRYGGFKPYVGGGLGLSHVSWSGYDFTQICAVDPGEDCGTPGTTHSGATTDTEYYDIASGSVSTNSGVALTYSLAAGVDVALSKNWTLDMGYKWTRIDDHVMIVEDADGPGFPGGDSAFDYLDLHEVRVGLRYDIW